MGISVVGGLLFSQLITLYLTPVVYVYMDRLQAAFAGHRLGSGTRPIADDPSRAPGRRGG
jgi:HAE1 family hydrophobic/amphiphilic exporter-1